MPLDLSIHQRNLGPNQLDQGENIQTLALYQSISCDHCNRHPSDKFDTAIPVDFQMLHLGTVSAHNQLLKTKMDKADA